MATEKLTSELMNEEQLDAVVGGTRGELSCDTKFLYALGLMNRQYEPGYCEGNMNSVVREVTSALRNLGIRIRIDTHLERKNDYVLGAERPDEVGLSTTRHDLYKMVCEKAGKPDFNFTKYI